MLCRFTTLEPLPCTQIRFCTCKYPVLAASLQITCRPMFLPATCLSPSIWLTAARGPCPSLFPFKYDQALLLHLPQTISCVNWQRPAHVHILAASPTSVSVSHPYPLHCFSSPDSSYSLPGRWEKLIRTHHLAWWIRIPSRLPVLAAVWVVRCCSDRCILLAFGCTNLIPCASERHMSELVQLLAFLHQAPCWPMCTGGTSSLPVLKHLLLLAILILLFCSLSATHR